MRRARRPESVNHRRVRAKDKKGKKSNPNILTIYATPQRLGDKAVEVVAFIYDMQPCQNVPFSRLINQIITYNRIVKPKYITFLIAILQ